MSLVEILKLVLKLTTLFSLVATVVSAQVLTYIYDSKAPDMLMSGYPQKGVDLSTSALEAGQNDLTVNMYAVERLHIQLKRTSAIKDNTESSDMYEFFWSKVAANLGLNIDAVEKAANKTLDPRDYYEKIESHASSYKDRDGYLSKWHTKFGDWTDGKVLTNLLKSLITVFIGSPEPFIKLWSIAASITGFTDSGIRCEGSVYWLSIEYQGYIRTLTVAVDPYTTTTHCHSLESTSELAYVLWTNLDEFFQENWSDFCAAVSDSVWNADMRVSLWEDKTKSFVNVWDIPCRGDSGR